MRVIVVLLTLYAAGVATWWLVERTRPAPGRASPSDPFEQAEARNEHVREIMETARKLFHSEIKEVVKNIDWRLSRIEAVRKAMDEGLAATQRASEDAAQGSWSKVEALEERLGSIAALKTSVGQLAERVEGLVTSIAEMEARLQAEMRELVKNREASAPPPADRPPEPTQPTLPVAPPPDPETVRAAQEKARRDLQSDDLDVLWPAIELVRKHRLLEAVPRLIEIMAKHKDPLGRTAAAAALGGMKVCDAVPALIEALLDKSDLVNQQANKSIRQITDYDTQLAADAGIRSRRTARARLKEWWRDNEAEVRSRLGQPRE